MMRLIDETLTDCHYVYRTLRSRAIFSATVVAVIALGMGLAFTTYLFVKTVVYEQPSVVRPDRLLYVTSLQKNQFVGGLTPLDYEAIAEPNSAIVGVLAHGRDIAVSPLGDGVQTLLGEMISGNYFQILGVQPLLGTAISPANADTTVVMISEGLWRTRFSAAPDILGKELPLPPSVVGAISARVKSYTIIGVVPSRFTGLLNSWERVQYWVPFKTRALEYQCDQPDIFTKWPLAVVARAAESAAIEEAKAAVISKGATLQSLNHQDSPEWRLSVAGSRVSALPLEGTRRLLPATAASAAGLVAFLVLTIAVVNVSGLLMARAIDNQRSAALRLALGITPQRLARQLLLETVVVSAIGGLLGLPLAAALTRLAISSLPAAASAASLGEPIKAAALGSNELILAGLVFLLVGIAIGLLPIRASLQTDIRSLVGGQSDTSKGVTGALQMGTLAPLVALTVVVLTMAVSASLHLYSMAKSPLGYSVDGIAFAEFQLARPPGCEQSTEKAAAFFSKRSQILARLTGGDVVQFGSAAVAMTLPGQEARAWILFKDGETTEKHHYVSQNSISAPFFDLVRIPIVEGRAFTHADRFQGARVAVVSRSLAKLLVPRGTVIGRSVAFHQPGSNLQPVSMEVVGIVEDTYRIGTQAAKNPTLYTPISQWAAARVVIANNAKSSSPADLANSLSALDSSISVDRSSMLRSLVDEQLRPQFAVAAVLGCAAAAAIVFSSVGLFGIVSYTTARRRREICVRMALGAPSWRGVASVLRQVTAAVLTGLLAGAALCPVLWSVAARVQLPLPSPSFAVVGMVAVIMLLVSCLACLVPALKAAQADPMELLKA